MGSAGLYCCDCPAFPPLGKDLIDYTNPKQVVFKGKVMSVGPCDELGTCSFEVQELYSGKSTRHITAVYDCSSSCMMNFAPGEEWIIYAEYLQVEKIKIEFCSRSRKIQKTNNEEIDRIAYGCSTSEELEWLRKNAGIKTIGEDNINRLLAHKNEKPSPAAKIVLLVVSIAVLSLFLIIFKKFLK